MLLLSLKSELEMFAEVVTFDRTLIINQKTFSFTLENPIEKQFIVAFEDEKRQLAVFVTSGYFTRSVVILLKIVGDVDDNLS